MLKPGQYTAAANMLKVHRNTISAHCHLLGELIKTNDMGQEYLQVRGLERSSGALAKTSVETIESVVQYYIASATTCAGKHDVVTNPDDRNDKQQKMVLYGLFKSHHRKFNRQSAAHPARAVAVTPAGSCDAGHLRV